MLDQTNFSLTASTDISRIVALRDSSLDKLHDAVNQIDEAFKSTADVRKDLAGVLRGNSIYCERGHNDVIFGSIHDVKKLKDGLRRDLDVAVWKGLMDLTGFQNLMDATAKEQFRKQLEGDEVPEVSEDTVRATFASLFEDADTIFRRGIATAFSRLDRRFKSHDGFKVGSRVIITNLIQYMGRSDRAHSTLLDIERAFAVLDGQSPNAEVLPWGVKGGEVYETRYFRIRTFQNGNAHLWMLRDDLVEKVNKLLGDFYGEVLPDAWETAHKDADRASKTRCTDLSADLQFYPTPNAVSVRIAEGCRGRILEPSAGEGSITVAALRSGAALVDCVEVDSGRAGFLRNRFSRDSRVSVKAANFLEVIPNQDYDFVLMNPPFFGTHYMIHVKHAFDFLKSGGILRAVLPITVETGESKAHKDFREWCVKFGGMYGEFRVEDLPIGSFKESGTNVNTCILTLRKR